MLPNRADYLMTMSAWTPRSRPDPEPVRSRDWLLFEYPTAAWRENIDALLPSLHSLGLEAIAQAAPK